MLGFRPKLPVTEDDRLWVDNGFMRLERMLGRWRMLEAEQILPIASYFPDPYDRSAEAAELLFQRLCGYMQVDRRGVEFEIFPDETEELGQLLPYWQGSKSGCAGLYTQHTANASDGNGEAVAEPVHMVVALRSSQLKDPLALVATLAHELGHVILLGGNLLEPADPDHEPLTDLLTVYLGLGIFTANSAGRFQQYHDERRQGWSMQRLGYLPEEVFGYALARFARQRGEDKPPWTRHLSTNVRSYFRRSSSWLARNDGVAYRPEPIG